jgi:cytoskeletal protein CcmA (bactofilin family)
MLRKKEAKPKPPAKLPEKRGVSSKRHTPSVISDDMNILGNLISDGYIDINGHVEGNVKCHSVTIRQHGMIKGDIMAESIQIYGQVSGIIKARDVHLASTARVRGVVIHETLSIEDGAYLDGQCKRSDRSVSPPPGASASASGSSADFSSSQESRKGKDDKVELIENIRVITDRRPA